MGGMKLFSVKHLLLSCGDVEVNPGPDVDYTDYLKIGKSRLHNLKFVVFNFQSLRRKLNQLKCFALTHVS